MQPSLLVRFALSISKVAQMTVTRVYIYFFSHQTLRACACKRCNLSDENPSVWDSKLPGTLCSFDVTHWTFIRRLEKKISDPEKMEVRASRAKTSDQKTTCWNNRKKRVICPSKSLWWIKNNFQGQITFYFLSTNLYQVFQTDWLRAGSCAND